VSDSAGWSRSQSLSSADRFVELSAVADKAIQKKYVDGISRADNYKELQDALQTLQSHFYEIRVGSWPGAGDWIGALMSSYISTTLSSVSRSLNYSVYSSSENLPQNAHLENTINTYFSYVVSYYFGEDTYSLRGQAYDDVLWVVLGWLDSIRFMNTHNALHYETFSNSTSPVTNTTWHGKQFQRAFAHRANVFYDIVQRAWDLSLCGGGLTWNPRLLPYKNTITNTLFITASVGMYLHHPGDNITDPFIQSSRTPGKSGDDDDGLPPIDPHDPSLLKAAIAAYDWLRRVNLTNAAGLYVDGYHISQWSRRFRTGPAQCDLRNEMVYTYNQGVILSGLRGLWEATGDVRYLTDGHDLVGNVIRETGWDDEDEEPGIVEVRRGILGRAGILEERCDPRGWCNQDGQAFKGIFFQHLAAFCKPLPTDVPLVPGLTFLADPRTEERHAASCRGYMRWVARNMEAALGTKNDDGVFGMWWGVGVEGVTDRVLMEDLGEEATDVRNRPEVLLHEPWARRSGEEARETDVYREEAVLGHFEVLDAAGQSEMSVSGDHLISRGWDLNDRGRGRTVETQGGGLSVVRALWDLRRWYA